MPLAGLRVIDLSRWIAGPHAALMMGDMGAEVVKIESPQGDPSRGSGPFVNGESTYFMALNRSKRGMALNLRNQAGQDILRQLIGKADILVENYRPGTLAEMGFPDDVLQAINPRLIIVSISGFGSSGPYAQRGCFDSIAQAMSGLQAMTGHAGTEPVRAGYYVADYSAALHACIGALLAVISRQQTGVGQRVDVALVESLLSMTATLVPGYLGAGVVPDRLGNSNGHAAPAGLFMTNDGAVQIAAAADALFLALARAMERPELTTDARYDTNAHRLQNIDALNAEIQSWTAGQTKQQVMEQLVEYKVPAGPMLTIDEIVADPQLRHNHYFAALDHPVAGRVEFAGSPIRLSATPAEISRPSPTVGQHNQEILAGWLDLPAHRIADFDHAGAFS